MSALTWHKTSVKCMTIIEGRTDPSRVFYHTLQAASIIETPSVWHKRVTFTHAMVKRTNTRTHSHLALLVWPPYRAVGQVKGLLPRWICPSQYLTVLYSHAYWSEIDDRGSIFRLPSGCRPYMAMIWVFLLRRIDSIDMKINRRERHQGGFPCNSCIDCTWINMCWMIIKLTYNLSNVVEVT